MKPSELTAEQIEAVCVKVAEYVRLCDDNGKAVCAETIEHSSLLRRLLAGRPPLPKPPPERFGLPAYELVTDRDEIEVQSVVEEGEAVTIDQHPGYVWLDRQNGIVEYPRLNLRFAVYDKDVTPDPSCVNDGEDLRSYTYTGKFMRRLS